MAAHIREKCPLIQAENSPPLLLLWGLWPARPAAATATPLASLPPPRASIIVGYFL